MMAHGGTSFTVALMALGLECVVGQGSSAQDKVNPLDVENKNSNEHLSTDGTFWTLGLNLAMFGVFCLVFESNRFYPQIYLKRCVKKFLDSSRVPARPPERAFGWLWSLWQVSEDDLLGMVGLDGFMLLRFHVVCLKLCCFLSFWGLLVLTPLYSTAAITSTWDTYTLTNVLKGEDAMKFRIWAAVVFGYIFSAYFCKLLQTEYNAFCIRRLIYLTQQYNQETSVEGGALSGDPDTPQQTYYTVMVERLPKELRSPQKLRNYFDDIFPGEVYAVEVMYDLSELNALCTKRHDIQNKLEHAIADFEVTGNRPVVYIQSDRPFLSPGYPPELEARYLPPITSWTQCVERLLAPEEWGFEPHDAIHYYTNQLIELNKNVKEQQEPHDDQSPRPGGAAGGGGVEGGKSSSKKSAKSKDMLELAKEKGTVAGALASKITDASNAGLKSTREYLQGFSATRAVTNFLFGEQTNDFSRELVKQERKAFRKTSRALSVSRERKNSRGGSDSGGSPARERVRTLSGEREPGGVSDWSRIQSAGGGEGTAYSATKAGAGGGTAGDIEAQAAQDPQPAEQAAGDNDSQARLAEGESDEESECGDDHAPLDLATLDPHELTPASFMRKLSVSRKATLSATDGELQSALAAAGAAGGDQGGGGAVIETETGNKTEVETHEQDQSRDDSDLPVVTSRPFSSSMDCEEEAASVAVISGEGQVAGVGEGEVVRNPLVDSNEGGAVSSLSIPSSLSATTTDSVPDYSSGSNHQKVGGRAKKKKPHRDSRGEDDMNVLSSIRNGADFRNGVEMAKSTWRFLSTQASDAAEGLKRGIIEGEKLVEMMAWGSFYKLSSTAFVTFRSRVTTAIARQMLISHDDMQILAAPNPKDIIWENIDKPRSLLVMRNAICEVGMVIASIFWSSLVTEVNAFSTLLNLPHAQQELCSVVILLCFLLVLPYIFDWVARNYECMKLESEIQNSIMNRYFWYQLINVYVTVGLGSRNFAEQLLGFLRNPQSIVDVLGKSVPAVSLYFCNLMIVKIFAAVPIEMLRPWQLSTIHLMYASMDTRKATRRDLRSGAFYAWPMLYGWVYPQLLMVLMIVMTYSTIAPLLPPFGVLFFIFAYVMYKYQLLYVYINDYQSGGFMWYAVFARSVVALLFASITLLGYLSLQMQDVFLGWPFWFTLPLPPAIVYFWYYCDAKYKRQSMELAFGYAKTIDHSSDLAAESGRPRPQDFFSPTLYRQPSLLEKSVFPEPHRSELLTRKHTATTLSALTGGRERIGSADSDEDGSTYNPLMSPSSIAGSDSGDIVTRNRRGSMSLNVVELVEDGEETQEQLENYFNERVVPLSVVPEGHIPGLRAPIIDVRYHQPEIEGPVLGAGAGVGAVRGSARKVGSTKPRVQERSISDINVGVGGDEEEGSLVSSPQAVETSMGVTPSSGGGRGRKVSFDSTLPDDDLL